MVTVTTTHDVERTFPAATGWTVDSDMQLDVTTDTSIVVASFAPGAWESVHHTDELQPDEAAPEPVAAG